MPRKTAMPPVHPCRTRKRTAKGTPVSSSRRKKRRQALVDPVDVAPTCPATRAAGNALVGDGMSPSIRAVYRSELADKVRLRRHKVSSRVHVVRSIPAEPVKGSRGAGARRDLRWENVQTGHGGGLRRKVRWEGPDHTVAGRKGRDSK